MEIVRESIFVTALRTFCRMFFGMMGLLLAFILFSAVYSSLGPSQLTQEKTTMHLLPDAMGNQELLSTATPAILEIPIDGVIGDPKKLTSEMVRDILIDSRRGLLSNNRVKGILLNFNTPGGTVVDADDIYRMLKEYKAKYEIPIFAYVDGLCASGGMYIASAADEVFASPSGVIGSVGVIMGPFFNIYDFMGKVGLQARTLTQGLDKDMMNPTRPWKQGEDASLNAVMAFMYNRFVHVVTEARTRLDKTKLVDEYGAQVFNCVEAERLGYIDHAMSSRDEALTALLTQAKLNPKEAYQVVTLSPKNDWLTGIINGKSPLLTGKIEHEFELGQTPIRDQFAYLYQP